VIKDLGEFEVVSDVIVANWLTEEIEYVGEEIYTRNLFVGD
jgi:hypothetical protein